MYIYIYIYIYIHAYSLWALTEEGVEDAEDVEA
jgi:hypothetical protein